MSNMLIIMFNMLILTNAFISILVNIYHLQGLYETHPVSFNVYNKCLEEKLKETNTINIETKYKMLNLPYSIILCAHIVKHHNESTPTLLYTCPTPALFLHLPYTATVCPSLHLPSPAVYTVLHRM